MHPLKVNLQFLKKVSVSEINHFVEQIIINMMLFRYKKGLVAF